MAYTVWRCSSALSVTPRNLPVAMNTMRAWVIGSCPSSGRVLIGCAVPDGSVTEASSDRVSADSGVEASSCRRHTLPSRSPP
ncbi:hypothetical protein D3C83_33690 [compost metagenome]